MLKAYLSKIYDWFKPEDVTSASFDSSLMDIDYTYKGNAEYSPVEDMTELLEFAIEWGKKHG